MYEINPLVLLSAFTVATGVRAYFWGPNSTYSQVHVPDSSVGSAGVGEPAASVLDSASLLLSSAKKFEETGAESIPFDTSNGVSISHDDAVVSGVHSIIKDECAKDAKCDSTSTTDSNQKSPDIPLTEKTRGKLSDADNLLDKIDVPSENQKSHLSDSNLNGSSGASEAGGTCSDKDENQQQLYM